jgi:hypothetical protein
MELCVVVGSINVFVSASERWPTNTNHCKILLLPVGSKELTTWIHRCLCRYKKMGLPIPPMTPAPLAAYLSHQGAPSSGAGWLGVAETPPDPEVGLSSLVKKFCMSAPSRDRLVSLFLTAQRVRLVGISGTLYY